MALGQRKQGHPGASGHNQLAGIVFVILSAAAFASLDTTTKYVGRLVPFVIVIWFRFAIQIILTGGWLISQRRRLLLPSKAPRLQLWRGLCLTASSVLAFFSLTLLPMADFTAIALLTPLVMTVVAARVFGESVSVQRWLLVAMGFVGAMVVIRPGHESLSLATLVHFALVISSAGYQLLTVQLSQSDDVATTHWYSGWIGFLLATLALPFAAMTSVSTDTVLSSIPLLILIGIFASCGHGLLIAGLTSAPVATLTPYQYAQIPFAMLGGWLVFSQKPDFWALIGIGIIAVCGVLGTWALARELAIERRKAILHSSGI